MSNNANASHLLTLWGRKLPSRLTLPHVHAVPTQKRPLDELLADAQYEKYGYLRSTIWHRQEGYIRWMPPTEEELLHQVEYDMDEQDTFWLDQLNKDRKNTNLDFIDKELFEIAMDRLEKEWFDLQARIPKLQTGDPAEDSTCEICNDGECENSNAIVFCDGCNLAVHQDCYGVPYIPEGQWLCRKCTVSPHQPVYCVLCPNEAGAFKQTTIGSWAHLLCSIFIPECGVSNTVYMEPIDGILAIPKARWRLENCYLCRQKQVGACIQCDHKQCFAAFHVTCAREYGLPLQFRRHLPDGRQETDHKSWCHRHVPRDFAIQYEFEEEEEADGTPDQPESSQQALVRAQGKKRRRDGSPSVSIPRPKKLAKPGSSASRAHSSQFLSHGPPVIPKYIFDKLHDYVLPLIKKKNKAEDMINMICRYWSLKRETRRGAGLLTRLHLEPWTATSYRQFPSDLDKDKKMQFINLLRADLGKVSDMLNKISGREQTKLTLAETLNGAIQAVLFPLNISLHAALDQISSADKGNLFLNPVSKVEAQDYERYVKKPMCWRTMRRRIDEGAYLDVQSFKDDVALVLANAKVYNPIDHAVHKEAIRMGKRAEPILKELDAFNQPKHVEHRLSLLSLLSNDRIKGMTTFDPNLPFVDPADIKALQKSPPKSAKRDRRSVQAAASFPVVEIPGLTPPRRKALVASADISNLDLDLILPQGSRRGGRQSTASPSKLSPSKSPARAISVGSTLSELSGSDVDIVQSPYAKSRRTRANADQVAGPDSTALPEEANNMDIDEKEGILADALPPPPRGKKGRFRKSDVRIETSAAADIASPTVEKARSLRASRSRPVPAAIEPAIQRDKILPSSSRRGRSSMASLQDVMSTPSATPKPSPKKDNRKPTEINGPSESRAMRNSTAAPAVVKPTSVPANSRKRARTSEPAPERPAKKARNAKGKATKAPTPEVDELEGGDQERSDEESLIGEIVDSAWTEPIELLPFMSDEKSRKEFEDAKDKNRVKVSDTLEEGSLVWATDGTWPYWPAEFDVFEPKKTAVDPKTGKKAKACRVIFFEKQMDDRAPSDTLAQSSLYHLGQDTRFDDLMASQQPDPHFPRKAHPRLDEVARNLRVARGLMEVAE